MQDFIPLFKDAGLLPCQAEFAASVLSSDSGAKHFLIAENRSGKSHTAIKLVDQFARLKRGRPALVLLRDDFAVNLFVQSLQNEKCPAEIVVTRSQQTVQNTAKLLDEVNRPDEAIVVAVEPKTQDKDDFATVSWGLVVIDSRSFSRRGGVGFYNPLFKDAVCCLMTNTVDDAWPVSDFFGCRETRWSLSDMVDWDGTSIKVPEKKLIEYSFNEEESLFAFSASMMGAQIDNVLGLKGSFSALVNRKIESSLYTLERLFTHRYASLKRKRSDSVNRAGELKYDFVGKYSASEIEYVDDLADRVTELEFSIKEMLEEFEDTEADSKLEALTAHLNEYVGGQRICLVCVYAETAGYLNTCLNELGFGTSLITGSSTAEARRSGIRELESGNRILIATADVLRGIDGCGFDYLISYEPLGGLSLPFYKLGQKNDFTVCDLKRVEPYFGDQEVSVTAD